MTDFAAGDFAVGMVVGAIVSMVSVAVVASLGMKARCARERRRCAIIAKKFGEEARAIYKGRTPETDTMKRYDPHTDGLSDAGFEIESRILEAEP